MASKRRIRNKSCTGKKRFTSKDSAWRAAWLTGANISGRRLQAYRCLFCGAWHIGHKKEMHPDRRVGYK